MVNRNGRPSGRFVLRLDPGLHASLRRAAQEAGISLNDYCARKLAAPSANLGSFSGAAVEKAARIAGDALIGIVIYGSWSRGTLLASSDVDLLVVVDRELALTRQLYRFWDETPLSWNEHLVEPHFVHLPDPDEVVGGLWAEVALDGIVLFESGAKLSLRLVEVRHDIAEGRIVRKTIHGQPYWTQAA
jgi:predicted nucleotidyltransferase